MDAVGEFEKFSNLDPLHRGAKPLNVSPVLGTADARVQRDKDQVGQHMELRPFDSRIGQILEL